MKIVHAKVGFGYEYHETDFEFEDNATTDEIERKVLEWTAQFIDYSYEIKEKEEEGK